MESTGPGGHATGTTPATGGPGIYLHIPFCAHRCDYCSFAAWDDRHHLTGAYLTALDTELGQVLAGLRAPVTSVFVGGGTPSQVPAAALARLIGRIPLAPGAEVTVEVNPEDAGEELFATYRDAGVNRVSLGVQSMVPEVLESLGRRHRASAVAPAVAAARSVGIDQVSCDLIYGAAGESVTQWRYTLDAVVHLNPDHISAYALTVEPGTPLAGAPARHPDDDDQAAKYRIADAVLTGAGMANYEISNWAVPGSECRHNQLYWAQGEYWGVGCGAHSHAEGRRWWNVRTPERYVALVERGDAPEAGSEQLSDPERALEGLQLAVRTRSGVPAAALAADDVTGVLAPLVEHDGDRVHLTLDGRLLANEVAIRLRPPTRDVPPPSG